MPDTLSVSTNHTALNSIAVYIVVEPKRAQQRPRRQWILQRITIVRGRSGGVWGRKIKVEITYHHGLLEKGLDAGQVGAGDLLEPPAHLGLLGYFEGAGGNELLRLVGVAPLTYDAHEVLLALGGRALDLLLRGRELHRHLVHFFLRVVELEQPVAQLIRLARQLPALFPQHAANARTESLMSNAPIYSYITLAPLLALTLRRV